MKRIILPLVLFLCFYGESLFAHFTADSSFFKDMLAIPHFLLASLILTGIYFFRNTALVYAAVFGLIFDIYYTGMIGAYLFLFPIAVYLAAKMKRIVHLNVLTSGLIVLLNIALVEMLIYGLNMLLFNVPVTMAAFLKMRLAPSLSINLIFYILIFFPFTKWLQNRQNQLLSD
jgi:rod shape-determining protein MreD